MRGWLALLFLFSVPAQAGSVYVAEIRGSINPGAAAYLERVITLAGEDPGAGAVLVELDTPGGLLASTREMVQSISRSKVPVLVYVGPSGASATSAGAILTMASHAAGMSPGSNIGAAHPVASGGQDIPGDLKEKSVNDTVALVRSLAEERGRPAAAAESMVRQSRSFSASEALASRLIESVAETSSEFVSRMHGKKVRIEGAGREVVLDLVAKPGDPDFRRIAMSPGQRLLHFLADPNVATLLMSFGAFLIYVEVSNPGITIAGVLGGICLITGFMAFQLLPIRAGGMLLLVLGILMMVLEAVVVSHGALGLGGLISLVLGILWVMDPSGGALRIDPHVWIPVVATLAALMALLAFAAARTRRLVARTLHAMKGRSKAGLQGYEGVVEWVDPERPDHGRILIRGEGWSAVSGGEPLRVGQRVEVQRVDGFTVRVR